MDNSGSEKEPLLAFELWRWASDAVFAIFYAVKHMREIIFIWVRCQITWRPFLFPIGPLFQLQYNFLA